MRYNAGNWLDRKYGDNLRNRELNMTKDCASAVVIWQDYSGVIAENLENLKKMTKPIFLFEYHRSTGSVSYEMLDPNRIFSVFFPSKR